MSVQETREMNVADSDGVAGDPFTVERFIHKSVQFFLASGSYLLQVSNDGSDWFNIGGAITTNTLLTTEDPTNPIPKSIKLMRIFTTTVASNDLVATAQVHDPV